MNTKEIENTINKINAIICSRMITEEDVIKEIHIVSNMTRSPKQLTRDIQSVLISKFDIDIDYKIISVAQIEDENLFISDFRLRLHSIEYVTINNTFQAKVILEKDEILYEGTSEGPHTTNNVPRILATAVIQAAENFCNKKSIFILEDVMKIILTGRESYVTLITSFIDKKEVLLSGSAVNGRNSDEMIVKSTLDAINRVLNKLSRNYQTR